MNTHPCTCTHVYTHRHMHAHINIHACTYIHMPTNTSVMAEQNGNQAQTFTRVHTLFNVTLLHKAHLESSDHCADTNRNIAERQTQEQTHSQQRLPGSGCWRGWQKGRHHHRTSGKCRTAGIRFGTPLLHPEKHTLCKAILYVTKQYHVSQSHTLCHKAISCITKQYIASQSNTLHHKAIPCITKQYCASQIPCITKQYLASQSNTLLHKAIPCFTSQSNTLHRKYLASQSNTLLHKAIPCFTKQYLQILRAIPLH